MKPTDPIVAEAKQRLLTAADALRQRLEAGDTKELVWLPPPSCPSDAVAQAKVRRGYIILRQPANDGVPYTSSFGASSDNSYSGFLPGVTIDEAKLLVYGSVARHNNWIKS